MGYTTDFYGEINITPALNEHEVSYLGDFSRKRRMKRAKGPYYLGGSGFMGQGADEDIQDYNSPDPSQPQLWCQWIPGFKGTVLEWDGGEKFYSADVWMKYLIDTFLSPEAQVKADLKAGVFRKNKWPLDRRLKKFTFDHVCNGEIEAQGEDPDDRWKLIVRDNTVYVSYASFVYEGERMI